MNQRTRNKTRDKTEEHNTNTKEIRQDHSRPTSRKNNVNEQSLDEAIEMTFPASDPIALTPPHADEGPNPETADQSDNAVDSALRVNNK